MPVTQDTRERLRNGLLGPLGEEVTGLLMHELDQRGLRSYIDERFAQVDQRFEQVDKRFDQMDRRFERIEDRLDVLSNATIESRQSANRLVYTISAAMIVLALSTLFQTTFLR